MSTDTKYSLSAGEKWSNQPGRPRLSHHIVGGEQEDGYGRWAERTPPDAVSPETAWEQGVDIEETVHSWFAGENHREPDRVRLYADDSEDGGRYMVAFLVVEAATGDVAVTVVRPDNWDDPAKRSYCHSRAEEVIQS